MTGPAAMSAFGAFDATGTGLAVWTEDRLLAYANRPFFSAFQLEPSHVLGYDDFLEKLALSGELVLDLAVTDWLATCKAQFGMEAETEQPMSDGRTLEIAQRPVDGGGMLITVHDISKLKRTEFALRRAKEAAEATGETKSRFLRAANHDLRQPLATLKILI